MEKTIELSKHIVERVQAGADYHEIAAILVHSPHHNEWHLLAVFIMGMVVGMTILLAILNWGVVRPARKKYRDITFNDL